MLHVSEATLTRFTRFIAEEERQTPITETVMPARYTRAPTSIPAQGVGERGLRARVFFVS